MYLVCVSGNKARKSQGSVIMPIFRKLRQSKGKNEREIVYLSHVNTTEHQALICKVTGHTELKH